MAEAKDIQIMVAGALQHAQPDLEIGLDDNRAFVRSGSQVFRVWVEEVSNFADRKDDGQAAKLFMQTLPYGPGL